MNEPKLYIGGEEEMQITAEPFFGIEALVDVGMLDDELALTAFFCDRAKELLKEKGAGDRKRQLLHMIIIVDLGDNRPPFNEDGRVRVVGRFKYWMDGDEEK